MPTKGERDKGFKQLDEAVLVLKEARALADNAYLAAVYCDEERARRLIPLARARAADVRAILAGIPTAVLAFFALDDVIRRILASINDTLQRIPALLVHCRRARGLLHFRHRPGGTFQRTRVARAARDTIHWRFDLNKRVRCRCLCLVSVFHFEEKRTGRIVRPMSEGFLPGFDPLLGKPHEGRDVDGYAVDSGTQRWSDPPSRLRLVPKECPCDATSTLLSRGRSLRIEGYDSPNSCRSGLALYFETAVVCLDGRPYTVLGAMRWRLDGDINRLDIIRNAGRIDWGHVSERFQRALLDWMTRYGRNCCPPREGDAGSSDFGLAGGR